MSVGFAVPRAVAGQSPHLAKTASRRSAANLKLPSYGVRGEEMAGTLREFIQVTRGDFSILSYRPATGA